MSSSKQWLSTLKAAELYKFAVSIGTSCSGTKAVQVHGIQHALSSLPKQRANATGGGVKSHAEIKVVSIDMGIKNLAYSAWISKLEPGSRGSGESLRYHKPVLTAWRKIDVSSAVADTSMDSVQTGDTSKSKTQKETTIKSRVTKASFEPIDYADRAYDFIQSMLAEHSPSHVLIERQRFRTGGNSAVQEWTIRVGVFEGMLYAVLKSLAATSELYRDLVIEPVLPIRVNRYWLENLSQSKLGMEEEIKSKKTAREVKQMKISLVKDLLIASQHQRDEQLFDIDPALTHMVSIFLNNGSKGAKKQITRNHLESKTDADHEMSKLDDLADCFLQGLAWIQWYNNRLQLDASKQGEFPL